MIKHILLVLACVLIGAMLGLEIAMFVKQEIYSDRIDEIYSILNESAICESSESK